MANKTKLITLCMIVKNEERDLPRCLRSAKGIADQIVVVDTGSTDGTVEMARKFGAAVVRSEWTEDFAGARNKGLVHAEGEWILFLDADEELDAGTREQLRTLAQHREITGYFLNVWNYSGDGGDGATINPVLRMFRNDRRYRFEGRIHEQIAAPIMRHTPQARFHLSDVIIHHYGYRREVVAAKDKVNRNRTLLELAIQEEPDNRFNWYNLGVEYFRAGEVGEALSAFRRARDGIDYASVSYAHLLVKHETSCLQVLRRWEEALRSAEEGLIWYAEYPDLQHARGVSLAALGRRRQAAEAFAAALAIGKAPALYHTEDGMGTYQSAYWLGTMHEAEQDMETAAHWYTEAVRHKSSLLAPLYRLCRMMNVSSVPERLAAFIETRFTLASPRAVDKLAGILLDCGCHEALRLWLGKWAERADEGERAVLQPWLGLAGVHARLAGEANQGRAAGSDAAFGKMGTGTDDGEQFVEPSRKANAASAGGSAGAAESRLAGWRATMDWLLPGREVEAEAEMKVETETEMKVETEIGGKAEARIERGARTRRDGAEREPEFERGRDLETGEEKKRKTRVEPKAERETGPGAETEAETGVETEAETGVETKVETKTETEVETTEEIEAVEKIDIETDVENEIESGMETIIEAIVMTKTLTETETETETGTETTERKNEAGVATVAGPEPQSETAEPVPSAVREWLPFLLAGGAGGPESKQRIRSAVGMLLSGKPSDSGEAGADTAAVREGVRAGARAVCALADRHLAAAQQSAKHAQAVQSIRLALPVRG
ncbi:tetratricopeptide repeat-containing glycosyltransferase family 2 protein [Paenibacillus sacheonensis]|uniref:Glycosyltransferase n=1 Tax=Paenibacillus sacheonensis TaxID=742054 RepID=A0A7X4YW35_9BACL|nr:glycosyltransferase [Paenibacillus sacheonensis]MBM7566610.1 glycosyltransferase involved in cell wall biosynthesis [Paenibacillus sacheonensis]NBC73528.1 glycosyltransferase [Paenibacillus sacheonensis]